MPCNPSFLNDVRTCRVVSGTIALRRVDWQARGPPHPHTLNLQALHGAICCNDAGMQ